MRSLALIAAMGCGLVFCQGCGTPVRGPDGDIEATIKYGTLTAMMDRGIERVYQAVQDSVAKLGLTTVMAEQDGVAAEVLARDAQGQNISIRLEAVSTSRTELTMRIGMLGDKNKSRVVFREIQDNLRAV
ncbi:MAG: DUF3568 family protein [Phycisphaerales bacterium]